MKYILLLFVLAFILPSFAQQYFLSVNTGSDTNNCTSSSDPCQSLSGVLGKTVSNNDTQATVTISAGSYTGPLNTDLTFIIPMTIEDADDGDVIFDCAPFGNNFAFFLQADGDLNDITVQNCPNGIMSGFGTFSDLTLDSLNFYNDTISLYFEGDDLDIDDCFFMNADVQGISIRNGDTITINDCYFEGILGDSISLDYNGNISSVAITENVFNQTAGINIRVESETNTDAELRECDFMDVTGSDLITLNGGEWDIHDITVTGSTGCTAINYLDTGSGGNTALSVFDSNINACETGVTFNATGPLTVNNGTFSSSNIGVNVLRTTSVSVSQSFFTNGAISVNSGLISSFMLDTVQFMSTVACNLSVSDSTNGEVSTVSFTSGLARAFNINRGNWTFDSLTINSPSSVNGDGGCLHISTNAGSVSMDNSNIQVCTASGNGGAIYFDNTNVSISNSDLSSNTATVGGAVFVSNMQNFMVSNSDFTGNIASGNGGAIDLESVSTKTAFMTSVTFTSNTAVNGSAVSCCTVPGSCNITVSYDAQTPVTLTGNTNTGANGEDITCNLNVIQSTPSVTPTPSMSNSSTPSVSPSPTPSMSNSSTPTPSISVSSSLTNSTTRTPSMSNTTAVAAGNGTSTSSSSSGSSSNIDWVFYTTFALVIFIVLLLFVIIGLLVASFIMKRKEGYASID